MKNKTKRITEIKEEYKKKVFTEKIGVLERLKQINHDLANLRKEFRTLDGGL